MKDKIQVHKEVFPIPGKGEQPLKTNETIFIPAVSSGQLQSYFLVDFKNNSIIEWDVDLTQVIQDLFLAVNHFEGRQEYPWNCKTLQEYIETIFFAHSAEYYNGWIFVSFYCGNFILLLNVLTDEYNVLFDENGLTKLYSSTNQIQNNRLYFSRWEVEAGFCRMDDNDYLNDLEIGYFDLDTKKVQIIDTIQGKDEIHQTAITEDGQYILVLEERNEPQLKYPKELQEASNVEMIKLYEGGLKKSQLILYRIQDKTYQALDLNNCPAHIEFDLENPAIFYIIEHNISLNGGMIFLFGNAKIDTFEIKDNQMNLAYRMDVPDLYRCPSHKMLNSDNKKLMFLPSFPNRVFVLNLNDHTIVKNLPLSKSAVNVDFNNGPFKLPNINFDKTPYTVHPSEQAPYMFLSNLWNVIVHNYETNQKVLSVMYNQKGHPLITMGHASKFIL